MSGGHAKLITMTNDNRKAPTVWEDVNWTAPSILNPDRIDDAVAHVVTYFADFPGYTGPGYTGAMFNELGGGGDRPEIADTFTVEDVFAIATLSVNLDPLQAFQLIGAVSAAEVDPKYTDKKGKTSRPKVTSVPIDNAEVGRLLAKLETKDLIEATNDDLKDTDKLWQAIRRHNLGPTRVSKLLARKRPDLCPVIDSYIRAQLDHGGNRKNFFKSLRTVLRDENLDLPTHLRDIQQKAMAGTTSANAAGQVNRTDLVPGLHAAERISRLGVLRIFDIVLWMEEDARRERTKKRGNLKNSVVEAAQR